MNERIHYKVSVQELRERGYTFQKLHARNYKCYWKEIHPGYTIWCWVSGKEVEIKDFYCMSKTVLDYFLKHKDNGSMWGKGVMFPDLKYLPARLNRETGEILTRDEILKIVKPKTYEEELNCEYHTNRDWQELVFHFDTWVMIADEIKFLTKL